MDEARILGIKVHGVGMDEAVKTIGDYVTEQTPHLVVTLGTEMIMAAQKNDTFREAIEHASLVVPDAVGVVWAARRLNLFDRQKVAGIELMARLLDESQKTGWRVFFLGAAPGVAEEAAAALRQGYPGATVVGTHHGYFKDDAEVLQAIREAKPDILFLALGSPRQELWYWQHRDDLGVPVGMGVGGSFDVYAGRMSRAPRWMISLGLERTWRLIKEPSRWRRMTVLPIFALTILRQPRSRS